MPTDGGRSAACDNRSLRLPAAFRQLWTLAPGQRSDGCHEPSLISGHQVEGNAWAHGTPCIFIEPAAVPDRVRSGDVKVMRTARKTNRNAENPQNVPNSGDRTAHCRWVRKQLGKGPVPRFNPCGPACRAPALTQVADFKAERTSSPCIAKKCGRSMKIQFSASLSPSRR